jgi:hypothetical protein
MREAIRINEEEGDENPIQLTHFLQSADEGWCKMKGDTSRYSKIVYLGACDGWDSWDRFACYKGGGNDVYLWKGHLNSGKY